jgi:hypothetical protein
MKPVRGLKAGGALRLIATPYNSRAQWLNRRAAAAGDVVGHNDFIDISTI